MVKNGTVSAIQPSNDQPSVSHDVIDVDSYGSDPSLFAISSGTKSSSKACPSKKISRASPCFGHDLSNSLGVESSKSLQFMKSFHCKVKSAFSGSKNCGLADGPDAMKLPHGGKSSYLEQFESDKKGTGSSSSFQSNFNGQDGSLYPSGIE
jgi:hypothetical protein